MINESTGEVAVVVPNWNGADKLSGCLDSLLAQTPAARIIVVDNGSTDGSLELLAKYSDVEVIRQAKNLGFAGGVNVGIRHAMELGSEFVALLNNDAAADKRWLENLQKAMEKDSKIGIATGKLLSADGKKIDSTGEQYTNWGLPFPRGRGEPLSSKYDSNNFVFGASGGASLYRTEMLKQIGLFDEDFFAYYEDVDISFRAQLAGWKVYYEPAAVAYHKIGATSGKIKGFATYQTIKNLPMLLHKNVPSGLRFKIGWRFWLAHCLFFGQAARRGQLWPATKGDFVGTYLLFKKHGERRRIKKLQKVDNQYIWGLIVHDLPPGAHKLRTWRSKWRKLTGGKT